MQVPRSIYYFGHVMGISVYDQYNTLIGMTTGMTQRPNGKPESIGRVLVQTSDQEEWLQCYGTYVVGFGIKLQ